MSKRPILIIDALNLFLRNFTVNPTMSDKGLHVGGFIGFLKSLAILCDRVRPSDVIVVWEGGGSPRRRAIFKDYKQNRRPVKLNRFYGDEIPDTTDNRDKQVLLTINTLKKTSIKQLYISDCEADDVIGYITRHKFPDSRYVIASSDKDFYQLLNKRVIQWSPGQKQYITPKTLIEKFGISATNFCTARSFIGDPSDGLDGVSRAGFPSLSKRFPALAENKFISVEDLIEDAKYASETKTLKLFDNMISGEKIAKRNWKLMYLDMIGLSASQIQKIDYSLDDLQYNNDKIGLIKMLVKEGIHKFNADSFFSSIQAHTKVKKINAE